MRRATLFKRINRLTKRISRQLFVTVKVRISKRILWKQNKGLRNVESRIPLIGNLIQKIKWVEIKSVSINTSSAFCKNRNMMKC